MSPAATDEYTITISPAAYRIICGLVNGTTVIDPDYVIAEDDEWDEVRRTFPISGYQDLPANEEGPNAGYGSAFIRSPSYQGPMMI